LLLVVAHPDDEAFGCGSLLAHASASSLESTVVCATRGELGEVSRGTAKTSPTRLGAIREVELRTACDLLDVSRVEVLGWHDSGVEGDPLSDALVAAPQAEVAAAVGAIIERVHPHVVVTLDASDGHRDHAAIRDATLAAARTTTWRPSRIYLWCLIRSLMTEFTGDSTLGTPDEAITTTVDVARHDELRWKAMRAHASQTPPYDSMPPALQRAFLHTDHLIRIDPPWTGGPLEADWVPT
jgi:N-acetyl-1-D-myo-inositol-2-amino-2-deoxy-alpha-D-glucopyranoside deacetylase